MKKVTLLAAAAAGYVLGTRAGRERYEQIRRHATKAWRSKPVQGLVDEAGTTIKDTAADVGGTVASKVGDLKDSIVHRGDDEDPPTGP